MSPVTYHSYMNSKNTLSFLVQLFSIVGGIYKLLDLLRVFFLRLLDSEEEPEDESTLMELPSITADSNSEAESTAVSSRRKIEVLDAENDFGEI